MILSHLFITFTKILIFMNIELRYNLYANYILTKLESTLTKILLFPCSMPEASINYHLWVVTLLHFAQIPSPQHNQPWRKISNP